VSTSPFSVLGMQHTDPIITSVGIPGVTGPVGMPRTSMLRQAVDPKQPATI